MSSIATKTDINNQLQLAYHDKDRWPEVRSWNLNQVKKLWDEEPARVQVIKDPRLGETSLVMMRKDHLEHILNLIKDIEAGQASISHNLELAITQIECVEHGVSKHDTELAQKAVKVLKGLVANLTSKIHVMKGPSQVKLSSPSPDEKDAAIENDVL
jgi:hypothetical protein